MAVIVSIPPVPSVAAMQGLIPVTSIRSTDGYDFQQVSVWFGKRTKSYFWWADGGEVLQDQHMLNLVPENLSLLNTGTREDCIRAVRRWGVRENSLPIENFQEPA